MGRFSRLETGRAAPAPVHDPSDFEVIVGGPSGVDDEPHESTLDATGCIAAGDVMLFMNEDRSALRWYSRAVDQDSTRIDGWTRMIQTLLLRGDLGDAAAWIGRALAAYPEEPALLGMRAVERARRGMIREAMAGSDAALERGPADPFVALARGQVLLLAENGNAAYCFDQAVKNTPPEDWKTPVFIAMILKQRRLWARAIDFLLRAAERSERQPLVWYQIGLCREAIGHRAQAERAFETAREFCESDDRLLLKLDRTKGVSAWRWIRGLFRRKR